MRIKEEIDPYLEMAEIQRRLYEVRGPAVLFENVKGSPFPAVCNLFGTDERSNFIFRSTIKQVKRIVAAKADPKSLLAYPWALPSIGLAASKALPLKSWFSQYVATPIIALDAKAQKEQSLCPIRLLRTHFSWIHQHAANL